MESLPPSLIEVGIAVEPCAFLPARAERGDWRKDPEAARLLASCAARPPRCTAAMIPPEHRWTSEQYVWRYHGRRAARLEAIYREYGTRLVEAGDREGYAAWHATDVARAIDEAVAQFNSGDGK